MRTVCKDGPGPSQGGAGAQPVGSLVSTRHTASVAHCPGPAVTLTTNSRSKVANAATRPRRAPRDANVLMAM